MCARYRRLICVHIVDVNTICDSEVSGRHSYNILRYTHGNTSKTFSCSFLCVGSVLRTVVDVVAAKYVPESKSFSRGSNGTGACLARGGIHIACSQFCVLKQTVFRGVCCRVRCLVTCTLTLRCVTVNRVNIIPA